MKITKLVFICLLTFLVKTTLAQYAHFIETGSIEFEKRINMFALIGKEITPNTSSFMVQAFEEFKKTQPQFLTLKSTLTFSNDKTLFVPVANENNNPALNFFGQRPASSQINIVAHDLSTKTSTIQKQIYDETFLVSDSLRKIKWKITDELRDIAGYPCRRANGLMMDSIYVVAFYTDLIPVSSGPESFSGLPGMILGVALPYENVTWFANKVTEKPISVNNTAPPIKGKLVNNLSLEAILSDIFKNRGSVSLLLKEYIL